MDASAIETRLRAQLPDWHYVNGAIEREYPCNGWRASVLLFGGIAHLAEAAWHHPDVTVSWHGLRVRLLTHEVGTVTEKDFELAIEIERLVAWKPQSEQALEGAPTEGHWRYRTPD